MALRDRTKLGIALAGAVLAGLASVWIAVLLFGASGVLNCVGSGTQAYGGICLAFATRQLPPQAIGSIRLDPLAAGFKTRGTFQSHLARIWPLSSTIFAPAKDYWKPKVCP